MKKKTQSESRLPCAYFASKMCLELEIPFFFKNHAFLVCGGLFTVAIGPKSSSYRTKAVPLSSKISLFSSELKSDLSSDEMDEEQAGDDITTTS